MQRSGLFDGGFLTLASCAREACAASTVEMLVRQGEPRHALAAVVTAAQTSL